MVKELNLSPEQKDEFRMLKSKFHQQFDTLEMQSRNINKLLTEEIVKENPDSKLIDSLINRFSEIQRSQKQVMVNHLLEVKSTCNPEQQAKFNRFVCRMREYQQNQNRRMQRMRRGQNPRNINNQN
jgi:Spy/CpxP family protein refolding chaperone